jgi:RNA 2',3'-cyclic 3'-phosphodiesterase
LRAFVAIFPPPEVREALLRTARRHPMSGEARWIPAPNVHLTLKFLGDVTDEQLGRIDAALDEVSGRHDPFEIVPSNLGAFPSSRKARILWVGVGEGSERLRALADDVCGSLEPLGFAREGRPYTAHVTLGRARRRPVTLRPAQISAQVPRFSADRMELVRSVLGEAGATYSVIATYPLSEGGD